MTESPSFPSTAPPAESWPRSSSLRSPSTRRPAHSSSPTYPTMPHIASAPLLLRRLPRRLLCHPALDVPLLAGADRERARWNVLAHRRAGAHVGILADRHRRDELRVRADESAVLDGRPMLVRAVVVAGDGAGADVAALADHRVAQVGEVIRLAALPERRVLQLHEVADVRPFANLRTGAQACKRAHDRPGGHFGVLQVAVREDLRAVAD